jgi:hypothetical protein
MIELNVKTDGDFITGTATLLVGSEPLRNISEIKVDIHSKSTDLNEVKREAAVKFRKAIRRWVDELDKEFPESA